MKANLLDDFVDITGAKKILEVSRQAVYDMMQRGELKYSKLGSIRVFDRRHVQELADKRKAKKEVST